MTAFPKRLLRALAEIGFIIFLFYTNLLMGAFTRFRRAENPASILAVLYALFTPANELIGLIGAVIGFFASKESGNDCFKNCKPDRATAQRVQSDRFPVLAYT